MKQLIIAVLIIATAVIMVSGCHLEKTLNFLWITSASSYITEDTVWGPNEAITVTSYTVVTGATLFIQPGTLVLFDVVGLQNPKFERLAIEAGPGGCIRAIGTSGNPIVFRSLYPIRNVGDTGPGSDLGLMTPVLVSATSSADCRFEYCSFEDGVQGLYVEKNNPVIRNCNFQYNAFGLMLADTGVTVSECSFQRNNVDAIHCYRAWPLLSNCDIKVDTAQDLGGWSILVDAVQSYIPMIEPFREVSGIRCYIGSSPYLDRIDVKGARGSATGTWAVELLKSDVNVTGSSVYVDDSQAAPDVMSPYDLVRDSHIDDTLGTVNVDYISASELTNGSGWVFPAAQ